MTDYTKISSIAMVPKEVTYRIVKRVHSKKSVERMRRRSIKKGWLTEDEAAERITVATQGKLKLPFLKIKSMTTGQSFCLFIEHGPILKNAISGLFGAYGLSDKATIPWF